MSNFRMASLEDDFDYMSEKIITECMEEDIKPRLRSSFSKRCRHDIYQKNLKTDEKNRLSNRLHTVIETEKREGGLNQPIAYNTNVGFKIMQKFGFKPGTGLGKSGTGRIEPISVSLKTDKQGLGRQAALKEVSQMIPKYKNDTIKELINVEGYRSCFIEESAENSNIIDLKSTEACSDTYSEFHPGVVSCSYYNFTQVATPVSTGNLESRTKHDIPLVEEEMLTGKTEKYSREYITDTSLPLKLKLAAGGTDVENTGANPNLTRSTPKYQEVLGTSTEPGDPVIDKVRDEVEFHIREIKYKRRLSGAQKRKLRRAEAIEKGLPVKPRARHSAIYRKFLKEIYRVSDTYVSISNQKRTRSILNTQTEEALISNKTIKNPCLDAMLGNEYSHNNGRGFSTSNALQTYKMAIVPTNFPEASLTLVQSEMIQEMILEEVLSFKGENSAPNFLNSFLDKGALLIICANEVTKLWLEEKVPRMVAEEGLKLKIGLANVVLQTVKVLVCIPKLLADITPEQVLRLMKSQNKGLKTQEWTVVDRKSEELGQTLVIVIDNSSLKAIQGNDCMVHLGLSRVTFSIISSHRQKEGNLSHLHQ